MDGGATPRPSPLLWPRAPLTQCRKVQAVKGERPLAVPVGAAHLLGGPGPQGFRESSASNACGVEPREGGAACLHPRGGVGGGEGGGSCVLDSVGKEQAVRCMHIPLSLSASLALPRVCRRRHARPLSSRALLVLFECVTPRGAAVLPFSATIFTLLHRIRLEASGDYPPNLSISLSGGKEINRDLPSSGERTGASPALNRGSAHAAREMWGEGLPACPRGGGRAPHI